MGIGVAPPASADPECQDIGAVTVCAQGSLTGTDQPGNVSVGVDPSVMNFGVPDSGDLGCMTPYGTYQNCRTAS